MTDVLKAKLAMVFDVESWGLFGDPFVVGYVIMEIATGKIIHEDARAIDGVPDDVEGEDAEWVTANVLPAIEGIPKFVRTTDLFEWFQEAWAHWNLEGAFLAADVPFPVEANFLFMVRHWARLATVYPLIDIASFRAAKGLDPLEEEFRFGNELPAHNPLNDSRQSARLFFEAYSRSPMPGGIREPL